MSAYRQHHHEPHFLTFIQTLEGVLAGHGENTSELQASQVNDLVDLERQFRKALIRYRWGPQAYKAFCRFILEEKRNILVARPFFRERNEVFKSRISKVLRDNNWRALTRYSFNYQFVAFVLRVKPWGKGPEPKRIVALANAIKALRADLVECNLPLAISQARMFWNQNQNSHLSYMDTVQTAVEGLLAAIDKFVPPYTPVFRAVAIGRMLGNFIEANSETFVHFYPADKRRIYRARKIIARALRDGAVHPDYDEVLKALNRKEMEEGDQITSAGELHHLLAAASVVSANALQPPPDEGEEEQVNPIEKHAAGADCQPDHLLEEADTWRSTSSAIDALPLIDQKLLRLKGVDFSRMGA